MSTEDIVLYNTEEAVKVKPTATQVETFDLVPPDHPALYKVLPEFNFENVPINPNSFASTLVDTLILKLFHHLAKNIWRKDAFHFLS